MLQIFNTNTKVHTHIQAILMEWWKIKIKCMSVHWYTIIFDKTFMFR